MIAIKDFKLSEFDSKTAQGTGRLMRVGTLIKLQAAREVYGAPLTIAHAFRTKADAKRIKAKHPGAVENSAHESGYALDLYPTSGIKGYGDWIKLLDAFWDAGFRRFGIMANTLHVDDDPGRPFPALWKYAQTSPDVWAEVRKWYEAKVTGR